MDLSNRIAIFDILASDEASFITGETLSVDGGRLTVRSRGPISRLRIIWSKACLI